MELVGIVEADYVTVPLDDAKLDAAASNVRSEAQLAELLHQMEMQMREGQRNSSSRRPRSCAIASAP